MNKQMLFIGGPVAGEWRDMEDPPRQIVQVLVADRPPVDALSDILHPAFGFNSFFYRLQILAGNSEWFSVYAPDGWSGDEIMAELLQGYKPNLHYADNQDISIARTSKK